MCVAVAIPDMFLGLFYKVGYLDHAGRDRGFGHKVRLNGIMKGEKTGSGQGLSGRDEDFSLGKRRDWSESRCLYVQMLLVETRFASLPRRNVLQSI